MNYYSTHQIPLDVHLSRIATTPERYFVELKKNDFPIASFDMKEDSMNRWKPVEPAPNWVRGLTDELSDAINKHRNGI